MRRIRWSPEAADDLQHIRQRIREDNPVIARRVVRTLYDGIIGLKTFPHRGRIGREKDTRELVITPLPYVVVYRVSPELIEVVRIWHGAQDWA